VGHFAPRSNNVRATVGCEAEDVRSSAAVAVRATGWGETHAKRFLAYGHTAGVVTRADGRACNPKSAR